MNMSLPRVKRLLPDNEYRIVREVVRARSLPDPQVVRLRGLVRGWRDKYVDRAHRQSREARRKGKPRSTRGAASNENTMRQADIMDWVLDRLTELEEKGRGVGKAAGAAASGGRAGSDEEPSGPSRSEVRAAIALPHVSTFGDLWAEFPDAPVARLRKLLWSLAEGGEAELATGGGIALTTEEQVAFVEEVQEIDGVPAARRARSTGVPKNHRDHFGRTKVVRIRTHNRSRGARNQAKRDSRGRGKR